MERIMFVKLFRPLFYLLFCCTINVFPRSRTLMKNILRKLLIVVFVLYHGVTVLVILDYYWNFKVKRKGVRFTMELFVQSLMSIGALLLFGNRNLIQEITYQLDKYLKPFKELIMEGRVTKFRIITFLGCAVIVLKLVTVSCFVWLKLFSYQVSLLQSPTSFLLGILTFSLAYLAMMGFALMECFLLYYCLLCWVLKRAIKVYIDLLDNNLDGRRIISYHSRITRAVSQVESGNSVHLFWIFLSFLMIFFSETYIVMHDKTNEFEVIFTAWNAMLFFVTVMSAASVGETAESLRRYVSENDSKFDDNVFYRLNLKMSASDNQLTVCNMFILKKVTLINVVGTFITYTVMML
ncbi:hypothetical protein JTE90_013616 [Oedothorax gibbosus]|uniref:Gustatory receptor n=1 Tax=Oedothorax gibbosus TaxID=931172 RepID=A0AAV6UPE7_9ARAC|nr:hypothetical protein JTE90_013616 [Oedothorax gibbosus]